MPGLSIDELSGGLLTLRGTAVFSTETGRLVTNVPLRDDLQVSRTQYQGTDDLYHSQIQITSERTSTQINKEIPVSAYYSAQISRTFQVPGGPEITIEAANIGLNAHGSALYIREGGNLGHGNFLDVQLDPQTGAPIYDVPSGFRLATSAETVQYGIASFLLNRFYNELSGRVIAGAVYAGA